MDRLARVGLLLLVLTMFAAGQWQAWSADDARLARAVLVAGYTLPLLAARTRPMPITLVVVAAASVEFQLGFEGGQAWFAILLAVYALGRHEAPLLALPGLLAVAASVLTVDIPRLQDGAAVEDVLPGWVVIGGVWGLGRWVRGRHAETAQLEERAVALERDRDEAARAAVAYERARIARELHDLVAHALAVTVVQAQGAQRVVAADPGAARDAMAAIERLSRQGLDELRRLLGLLDEQSDGSPLDPPPTLARVDDLVGQLRDTGLTVSLTTRGERNGIPAGVDLSAYRIVQEGLTNALKHAGRGASVELTLSYSQRAVEIVVADDGVGEPTGQGTGRGLIGMQERVSLYGGTLDAGPRPDGGYQLRVLLPWGGTA